MNRNYPDLYMDTSTGEFVDKFQKYPNKLHSYVPSGEFYGGPYGGSEPETQAVMNYILRYDFRNFLSYHSRGNVVYTGKYWFSEEYNKREYVLGETLAKVADYVQLHGNNKEGSGFLSGFTAAQTLKPSVTVETTTAELPTAQKHFQEAYSRTYLLPLYAVQEGRKTGYFKYRLYVEDKYIRDFSDIAYAKAHANILGGVIVEGVGVPRYTLKNPITRKDFIREIIHKNYDVTKLEVNALDTFIDDESVITTFAKNQGLLSAGNGYFRPNDNMTPLEAAVLIYRVDTALNKIVDYSYKGQQLTGKYPEWAVDPVRYVIYHNKMSQEEFKNSVVYKEDLKL